MFTEYIDKNSNHEVKETKKPKTAILQKYEFDDISIRNFVLYTRQVDYGQS